MPTSQEEWVANQSRDLNLLDSKIRNMVLELPQDSKDNEMQENYSSWGKYQKPIKRKFFRVLTMHGR